MTKFAELVHEKEFTGYSLAKASGISQTQIQRLLSGDRSICKMSLELAAKLARTLDISLEELLELREPEQAE